jgi:hypothetical protein
LYDAIPERDAGDAYGDDAGNWSLRRSADCLHGDGEYLPVYDYGYRDRDGDVYECAHGDQLHVDGSNDERDMRAEFPGWDTGDVNVCARARVGFLRMVWDGTDVLGE